MNQVNVTATDNDKTAQLYTSLIIYISLGTIVFSIFIIIRPYLKSVYGVNPKSIFPTTFLAWIPKMLRRPDEDTVSKFGLDVGMTLILLKNIIYMVACYTLYGLAIVLPVNATASAGHAGLTTYTISNIAPWEMSRYTVHIIGIIWNTIVTCFFVHRMWKKYEQFRRREWKKPKLHNYTVCLTRAQEQTPQEIFNYFDKIFPGEVVDVYKVEDIDHIVNLKSDRMNYVYGLEKARAKNTKNAHSVPRALDFCLCCEPCFCCSTKVPAQAFWLDRINKIENEIREKQNDVKYTKVVYVTFRHIATAMECAQLCIDIGRPHIAPELYDVRWPNHSISYRTIPLRTWIANTIIIVLLIFWSAIIAIATTFSNLSTLAKYLPGINTIPVELKAIIGAILPPLIIIISFAILKFLLSFVLDRTGPLSHSKLDKQVFKKLFLFYLINVFLISLLANTFLEIWNKILEYTTQMSPMSILLLLASNVGIQSSFYMNYILALSLTHIIAILHPASIIIGGLKRRFATTPREKLAAKLPVHYPFHIDMAQHCLIFLAILNFSTISPLILPIGLVYLCLIYFQMAFETTYTSFQEYDGFGTIFPLVVNRILVCLFMHHIVMAGMFVLATFYIGLIFCALCTVGTGIFIYYGLRKIKKVTKYGKVDDVTGDAKKRVKHKRDGRGYVHPGMWDAAIDLDDIDRIAYSLRLAQDQLESSSTEQAKIETSVDSQNR